MYEIVWLLFLLLNTQSICIQLLTSGHPWRSQHWWVLAVLLWGKVAIVLMKNLRRSISGLLKTYLQEKKLNFFHFISLSFYFFFPFSWFQWWDVERNRKQNWIFFQIRLFGLKGGKNKWGGYVMFCGRILPTFFIILVLKKLWVSMIRSRRSHGLPYLMFLYDTAFILPSGQLESNAVVNDHQSNFFRISRIPVYSLQ